MPVADTSNSYIAQAAADLYFDARLHAQPWTGASESDKNRALIQATRIFDSYITWHEIPDKTSDTFDQAIKDACCEMALVLLQGDTQAKDDMEGIRSVNLKGMAVNASGQRKRIIPGHVFALISHLAELKASTSTIEIVRS